MNWFVWINFYQMAISQCFIIFIACPRHGWHSTISFNALARFVRTTSSQIWWYVLKCMHLICDSRFESEIKICFIFWDLHSTSSGKKRFLFILINNLIWKCPHSSRESMAERRTLLINKSLPYWSVSPFNSFAYQFMKFMLLFFVQLDLYSLFFLSYFLFLVGSFFSLHFLLYLHKTIIYMKWVRKKEAFGVNIPKQNCLKTAFDMRDFLLLFVDRQGGIQVAFREISIKNMCYAKTL